MFAEQDSELGWVTGTVTLVVAYVMRYNHGLSAQSR